MRTLPAGIEGVARWGSIPGWNDVSGVKSSLANQGATVIRLALASECAVQLIEPPGLRPHQRRNLVASLPHL